MSLRENKLRILISCITVFIVMLGVGIISPILPIYAESFNVPYFIAGFVISAFGLARLVSDVPMGSFADRFGRKRMMLMGTIFFTISASIAAYSTDIYQLIFSRLIQGIGAAMLTTSAMAYIGDIAPANERGLYMSFFQGSFFLGVAAGPAVGGFIVELGGLRAPFITLSILAFIATIFTQFTVHECIQVDREERKFHVHFNEIMNMLRDKNLLVLYGGSIVSFTMVGGLRNVAIPLFSVKVIRLSNIEMGVILSVAAFASFVTIICSGSLLDKLGRKPLLVLGFLFASISCYTFIHANNFLSMVLIALIYGFSNGMIQPSQATIIIDKSNLKYRGLSVGLYRTFNDIGIIIGPILVGTLSDHFGLASPFMLVAFLCLIAGLITLAFLS